MKTLCTLLLLALPALAGAQVVVQPLQASGAAGTLRNPYVVYEYGEPRFQVNTPQPQSVPRGRMPGVTRNGCWTAARPSATHSAAAACSAATEERR